MGGLDDLWVTVGRSAVTTEVAGGGAADGVGGVEPVHAGSVVVPDGHGENHGAVESVAEATHATEGLEVVGVGESGLLGVAELIGDLAACDTFDLALRVGNCHTILDIDTLDGGEGTGLAAVGSDELGDDGDNLGGVHGPANTEEVGVAHAVAVEIASVLVADARVAVISITTVGSLAAGESVALARVGSVGRGGLVSLPDIHLCAASSELSAASVLVAVTWGPVNDVGLTVDELHVMGALRVTVSGSVCGTSGIAGVVCHSSVKSHLREVKGTIESTGEVGHVNIEGELVVLQVEALVGAVICQKVDTRSDVGTGDESESQGVSGSLDTVNTLVISTVKSAVGGASLWVWAEGFVPAVACVAVGGVLSRVQPSPVGVKNNLGVLGGARSSAGASRHRHGRVSLSLEGTDLLAADSGQKGESSESKLVDHFEGWLCEFVE